MEKVVYEAWLFDVSKTCECSLKKASVLKKKASVVKKILVQLLI